MYCDVAACSPFDPRRQTLSISVRPTGACQRSRRSRATSDTNDFILVHRFVGITDAPISDEENEELGEP
jgi:hypothetical protein